MELLKTITTRKRVCLLFSSNAFFLRTLVRFVPKNSRFLLQKPPVSPQTQHVKKG